MSRDGSGQSTKRSRRSVLRTGAFVVGAGITAGSGTVVAESDPSAAPDAEETIGCGATVSGELTPEDASGFRGPDHYQDVYRFDPAPGELVTVSMAAAEAGEGDGDEFAADPYLYLLGPDGSIVAEDDDSGGELNSFIRTIVGEDGPYTIVASSFGAEEFFEYDLTVACTASEEIIGERRPIECGDRVTGELTADDVSGFRGPTHVHDAYRFEGTADEVVTISLETEYPFDFEEFDEDDLDGVDGDGAEDGEYDGEDEHAGFDFGDPYLYLLGPDGSVLAQDDDMGGFLNSLIRRRLPETGSYTIVASSFGAEEFFGYELALDCRESRPPEVRTIGCGETVAGDLAPDDATGFRSDSHYHDTYVFDGRAGEFVTVSAESDGGEPYLYLLAPDGTIIAGDDEDQEFFGSRIRRRLPDETGEYTVIVTSFGAEEFFEYELALDCREATDPDLAPRVISCGDHVTGELTPDDASGLRGPFHAQDEYCFRAEAGDAVTVSMSAGEFGDSYLYLLDPTDDVVAEDDDGGSGVDALIRNHRPRESGVYTIVASSFGAEEFFEYDLSVQCQ